VSTTFGVGARLPSAKRRSRRVIEMEQHKTPRTFFCYPQYHDLNIRKVANGLRDLHCVAQHIIKRTVTNSLRLVPTKTCKRPTHQVSEVQDIRYVLGRNGEVFLSTLQKYRQAPSSCFRAKVAVSLGVRETCSFMHNDREADTQPCAITTSFSFLLSIPT
jgi:hypothetical protein